jgi:SAM-dependent methyltransferase
VVGIDPSGESAKLARKRIARAPFPVELLPLSGEQLPAPDGSFDSVVCTFTLCTIPDPLAALRQMRRVLAPGGRFFFVEHGRSDEPKVQRWQDRLNGAQRWLFGGCNLNRPMDQLITEAGFELDSLERYYAKGPKRWRTCTAGSRAPAADSSGHPGSIDTAPSAANSCLTWRYRWPRP